MKKKKQSRIGKFFGEFKAFITRGNVLDMAVGVIVGGAFNTIVTTLNKKILMPIVDLALSCIPGMESGLYTILGNSKLVTDSTPADVATVLGPDGQTYTVLNYIDWSALIEAILNFFFIALTLFIIIKVASSLANKRKQLEEKLKKQEEEEKAVEEPAPAPAPEPQPTEGEITIALLTEIRDSLKSNQKEGK